MKNTTKLAGAMLATLLSYQAFSQDVIVLDNKKEIYGTVKIITPHFIKYVPVDDMQGNLSKVEIKDVACIVYENGDKEVLRKNNEEAIQVIADPNAKGGPNAAEIYYNDISQPVFRSSDDDEKSTSMADKGRMDAKKYYKGYKGAKSGTALTACLIDPVVGLIPAIACASTPPKSRNLTLGPAHEQLMQDADYRNGYKKEAARIKKQQVWNGFFIGTGIYAVLLGILLIIGI